MPHPSRLRATPVAGGQASAVLVLAAGLGLFLAPRLSLAGDVVPSPVAYGDVPAAYTPLTVPGGQAQWPVRPAAGAWKSRSQLVWDARVNRLVRKVFTAWDPHPERHLDFLWEPSGGDPDEGRIKGSGRLLWLAPGGAAYVRDDIVSEYEGEMADGRPHGKGRMRWQSGAVYDGIWRQGLMAGPGILRLANGDRYEGAFAGGLPEGSGRYAAVDGTVFEGQFSAGERNGAGTLTMPGGRAFRSVWRNGVEIERTPLDGAAMAEAGGVSVDVYIDAGLNNAFIEADVEMPSYGYTATPGADELFVTLDAPEILDIWKGEAVLDEDSARHFEDPGQFAPVFLVVELSNDSNDTVLVTSTWFDLAQSFTDYQPYIVTSSWFNTVFDPNFAFRNFGWGKAEDARLIYAFGTESGPATQEFVTEIGPIDSQVEATAIDGMIALGVDIEALNNRQDLECPGEDEQGQCIVEPADFAHLLGGLAGATFSSGSFLMTRLTGRLEYHWVDAFGNDHVQSSPVVADLPLVYFGPRAEYGAAGPIERGFPTIDLPLDRSNVRLSVPYTVELGPGEATRFALNLVAEKSSRHFFRFLFELADGTVVASPAVDLLYFKPRTFELN